MPAAYAHYRFARQMAAFFPRDVEECPALYYAGCHGPDPLFYYDPFRGNAVEDLANYCHGLSGAQLLGSAPAADAPSRAYLFGLLTHYCLDSICHPYVNALAREGKCDHTELETEFDRYLLALDGEPQPHTRDLGAHLRLTRQECAVAAACYPGLTGREFSVCIRNMTLSTRILAGRTLLRRPILDRALPFFGGTVRYQLMTTAPNPRVAHLEGPLWDLYRLAQERLPGMARQLEDRLCRGTPLGEEFAPNFG